jgi:hypothetical protein
MKIIDLKSFLQKSKHPAIREFLDIEKFKEVRVDAKMGTIC